MTYSGINIQSPTVRNTLLRTIRTETTLLHTKEINMSSRPSRLRRAGVPVLQEYKPRETLMKMTTRTVHTLKSLWVLLAFLWLLAPLQVTADERPPNFIVIFCDNLGYGDVEPFGEKLHRTPHLNRMAREGRKFTHFYVSAGVCTPSRASIMTGCYAQRVGMHLNPRDGQVLRPVSPYGLNPDEVTIAEVLKQRGYATAIIGKWHLGDQSEFLPTRQGFDSFFGIPYSDDMTADVGKRMADEDKPQHRVLNGNLWPPLPLMENETVIEAPVDRDLLTKRYTERATEFIEQNRDKSFFLYLPQAMPGSTQTAFASPAFKGKSKNGRWGDSIEELDWSTGQILDKLVELEIDHQTLVVWTSDNGAPTRGRGDLSRGSNLPLHGRISSTAEGAFRVPTIMWWPGKVPAGTVCNELATTMDLLPTFARLADGPGRTGTPARRKASDGQECPSYGGAALPDRTIDGYDIRPLITGEPSARSPYEAFYYYRQEQLQAVRSGPWKLFLPLKNFVRHPHFRPGQKATALLFNVVDDISSKHNVAQKHPEIVQRLTRLAEQARENLGDSGKKGKGQRAAGKVERPMPLVKSPAVGRALLPVEEKTGKTGRSARPTKTSPIKVGFSEQDITPRIGMERPGGYVKNFHRTVHDPCKVRTAVFDDGHRTVAIIGVDALMLPRSLVLACRKRIEQQTGIPADAVMISASHSHSSGPTGMVQPGEYDHASEFVQKLAYEETSMANAEYLKTVEDAIVESVRSANETRSEMQCGFGSGREDRVLFNRRFRMRGGYSVTNPRAGNPEIVEAAGPIDPEVGVVSAWSDDGKKLVGCIVNYACHAVTNPRGISANYVYYIEKVIRGTFGEDVIVVFTAGASGDVTVVDNLSRYARRSGGDNQRFVGGRVGAEVVKVLVTTATDDDVRVASRSHVLRIKRRPPNPNRVNRAMEMVKSPPKNADAADVTFAKEIVLLDALMQKEPVVDAEVQAIQIGLVIFVSNPAEYFTEFGLDIKKQSPFPLTFPVSLANGCVGYVPTEEAFGPRGGGYETRLTSYSNLIPTAGKLIAEKSIELTKQFQPGSVPQRELHAPFSGSVWPYGRNRPELE